MKVWIVSSGFELDESTTHCVCSSRELAIVEAKLLMKGIDYPCTLDEVDVMMWESDSWFSITEFEVK